MRNKYSLLVFLVIGFFLKNIPGYSQYVFGPTLASTNVATTYYVGGLSYDCETEIQFIEWFVYDQGGNPLNVPVYPQGCYAGDIVFPSPGVYTLEYTIFANNDYATATITVTAISAFSVSTNLCGPKTLTRDTPPSGQTFYWQGKNGSGEDTSPVAAAVTYAAASDGTYYIRLRDNNSGVWSDPIGVLIQYVYLSPAPPPVPSVSSNTCGNKTLTVDGSPLAGVQWNWQGTNADGHTSNVGYSPLTVNTSGTYYIRAMNTNPYFYSTVCWSTPTAISVTVNQIPSQPPIPTVSSNACGSKTLTLESSPPEGTAWYWQDSFPWGTSTDFPGSAYTANSSNTFYVAARDNNVGCWSSPAGVSVTVVNPPAPTLGSGTYTFCEWDAKNLTATNYPSGGNVRWYSTSGQLLYTGQTYNPALSIGNYTFRVYSVDSGGCEGTDYATVDVSVSSCDDYLNWSQSTVFSRDASGNMIEVGSSRNYFDGLGTGIQSQTKSYSTNQVLAAQSVKNLLGKQVLSTMSAPINASNFGYKYSFITNQSGQNYKFGDFDLNINGYPGDLNNPKPVGNGGIGTLGWYYSSSNTLEPLTPVTSYPYSRTYSPEGPDPTISKSAGPGDQHKMGSGHEVTTERQKFMKSDLVHYYQLMHHFVPGGDGSDMGPGFWPIKGNITVVPGTTYKLRVKGYYEGDPASLYVGCKSLRISLLWPGPALPQGTEDYVEATFTVPMECSDIFVGVRWNNNVQGAPFYVTETSLSQVSSSVNSSVHVNAEGGYKFITTDPNGRNSVSFVDDNGRAIASATFNGGVYDNWSYIYYNDLGQVVATVAPNGINLASTERPPFAATYKYDHLGRQIEITSTDDGTTRYTYSTDGKIRFSQNQEQRNASPQRFSYTNYDYQGRLIEAGEYNMLGSDCYVFETHNIITPGTYSVLNIVDNVGFTGITRKSDPNSRCSDYSYIEYDVQASDLPAGDALHGTQSNTFGQVSKTENANYKTWYSYDEFGSLLWSKQSIAGLGYKTIDYTFDFSGNVTQIAYQQGQGDAFYHHYVYDADQRLSEVYTSKDGVSKTQRSRYHYYLHGPLKRVELMNGATKVQGLDYVYTIRGALKSINHADKIKDPGSDTDDAFGELLTYYDNDYQGAGYSSGSQTFPGTYPSQFGGSIKGMSWNSPADNNTLKNTYAYNYDPLYRFTNADWGAMTINGSEYGFTSTSSYQEHIGGYDKNGNINNLQRRDKVGNLMGDYSYVYEANTNRLDKINHAGFTLVDYTYNALGQMTQQSEGSKTMKVSYNVRGLVKQIRNSTDQLMTEYFYDDAGNRVQKTMYNAAVQAKNTFYVHDVGGNVMAIYEQQLPSGTPQLAEVPLYGAGRFGMHKPNGNKYFYEVTDHLGNVRAVIGLPSVQTYSANMENGQPGSGEGVFANYSSNTYDLVDHTDVGTTYQRIQTLNGGVSGRIGLSKSLIVTPGDKIKAEVYAKYRNMTSTPNATSLLTALATVFGVSSGSTGEQLTLYNSLNNFCAWIPNGDRPGDDDSAPKAFVTILLFDKNYNMVEAAWDQIDVSAQQVDGFVKTPPLHDVMTKEITVTQPGFAFVFLSNEHYNYVDVYYDDFTITHTQSQIVAGSDYYPFGLVMNDRSITDEAYRYGYQGQYSEKDDTNGFNEFELRMYDARFGRWLSVDPYGQFWSPYVGMGNNPVSGTDPDGGLVPDPAFTVIGMEVTVTATSLPHFVLPLPSILPSAPSFNEWFNMNYEDTRSEFFKFAENIIGGSAYGLTKAIMGSLAPQFIDSDDPEFYEAADRADVGGTLILTLASGGRGQSPGSSVVPVNSSPVPITQPMVVVVPNIGVHTLDARKSRKYLNDKSGDNNAGSTYGSEREARNIARTKLGKNPVQVERHKWRSRNGIWQYRAKPGDLIDKHIHLEKLNPDTGQVLYNLHLYWE